MQLPCFWRENIGYIFLFETSRVSIIFQFFEHTIDVWLDGRDLPDRATLCKNIWIGIRARAERAARQFSRQKDENFGHVIGDERGSGDENASKMADETDVIVFNVVLNEKYDFMVRRLPLYLKVEYS